MKEKPAAKKPRVGNPTLGLGIAFEILLIAAFFIHSQENWLMVEFYNLALISHYILFLFLSGVDFPALGIISALVYAIIMAYIWTAIFRGIAKWWRWKFAPQGIARWQKAALAAGLVVVVTVVLCWSGIESYFDRPAPFTPSPEAKLLVEGNNAFALDLYNRLKERPDNSFFSPYSISTGMGMVYAGARGATERELAGALHFGLPQKNLHPAFGELAGLMGNVQHWNHLTLLAANSLWYQRDYAFTPAYLDLIRANYQGEAIPVDFKQDAAGASREMGAWVEKNTHGRLKNAVSPGLFTPSTRLALCDTIYFKGRWASEFKRNNTYPRLFSITTNQTVTVPMMSQEAEFKLWHSPSADGPRMQVLEMPYFGRDLSMVIVLPEDVDGLPELEQRLNTTNLHAWLSALDGCSMDKVDVLLPRFTMTRGVDVRSELKSLGVNTLFDGFADLSGMDGSTQLYVDSVIHQAFVEVNEQGTEAAAVTMTVAKSKGMSIHERFIADHPFIFMIRDNATGGILFLGRVVDPTKS